MLIEFDKDYLRELFVQGRTNDKKHRYQPEIIKGYKKVRDVLKTSKQRGATLPYPLLELRSFTGLQKGCFIRANKQAIPT